MFKRLNVSAQNFKISHRPPSAIVLWNYNGHHIGIPAVSTSHIRTSLKPCYKVNIGHFDWKHHIHWTTVFLYNHVWTPLPNKWPFNYMKHSLLENFICRPWMPASRSIAESKEFARRGMDTLIRLRGFLCSATRSGFVTDLSKPRNLKEHLLAV